MILCAPDLFHEAGKSQADSPAGLFSFPWKDLENPLFHSLTGLVV